MCRGRVGTGSRGVSLGVLGEPRLRVGGQLVALTAIVVGFFRRLPRAGIVAAAVASVFAMRMGEAGEPLVPATFLVIFSTVACYRLTAGPLARLLGLSVIHPQTELLGGANQFALDLAEIPKSIGFLAVLVDGR